MDLSLLLHSRSGSPADDPWRGYARRLGRLDPSLLSATPDFMVIGPPKTGTSWMFANLSQHPGIYMPEGKELRYFDLHWRSADINSYVSRFAPGIGRLKGEASPTYCLLPEPAIAAIRRLNPAMKLILLARDPVAQAWSLLKHNYRHQEATFHGCQTAFEALDRRHLVEHFVSDYALSCLDHLGIHQRWRRFFPDRQIWVGTLEEIAADPHRCIASVLAFLGLEPSPGPALQHLTETVNAGLPHPIDPASAALLRSLHRRRASRFLQAIRRHYRRDIGSGWDTTWQGEQLRKPVPVPAGDSGHFLFDGAFHAWLTPPRRPVTVQAPFRFELDRLRGLHEALPRLLSPLLQRPPRGWAAGVSNQRLRNVLDDEARRLGVTA
jgi:hypothetical protein